MKLLVLRQKGKGSFLLTEAIQNINKVNSGTCPHGLAPGACPVCSGMGGGGSRRMGERPQKAGEMSYHQCAMIGAMIKARAARLENHEKNLELRAQKIIDFQQKLAKAAERLAEFANKISNIFVLKPAAGIIRFIAAAIAKINIQTIISNFMEKFAQIKQKFVDIQDKLNAIFGEMKAFAAKKISEILSTLSANIKFIFKIFRKSNTDNEDTKIDDDKKIFNLKNFIRKIRKKKRDDTKDKSRP